jgi:hypothetical protein
MECWVSYLDCHKSSCSWRSSTPSMLQSSELFCNVMQRIGNNEEPSRRKLPRALAAAASWHVLLCNKLPGRGRMLAFPGRLHGTADVVSFGLYGDALLKRSPVLVACGIKLQVRMANMMMMRMASCLHCSSKLAFIQSSRCRCP